MGIFLYTSLAPSRKNIPITFLVYFFFFYYEDICMGRVGVCMYSVMSGSLWPHRL